MLGSHASYPGAPWPGSVRCMTGTQPMPAAQPGGAARQPTTAPFGRMLTAMITPLTAAGAVDYDGAARRASCLVEEMRRGGLGVRRSPGESPPTSDEEKDRLLRATVGAVGDRATIVAGVGTNDTAHTCELARQAERAGARGRRQSG